MTDFFGEDFAFTITSPETPGVSRSYSSFNEAGMEDAESRLYGGVHFSSTNDESFALGIDIGNYVVDNFLLPVDNSFA